MQPYPRSLDLVWPGHLHGTGCLSARAVGTGFSYCCVAFVFGSGWRLGAGFVKPASPGWGLRWVCLGTVCGVVPLVSAVSGVRGWGSVSACFWDVCGFVGAPLAPRRFRFRRAVWACVLGPGLACAQPFFGLSGCVFCALVFSFLFFLLFSFRALWSLSLHPLSFGLGWWLSLFFFVSVSSFPVARCYWLGVAGSGWVVPLCLCGGPVFGAFWGGAWPPVVSLAGGLAAVGCFRAFSPSPLLFFWGGGGLPVPPSAFPGLAHALACIQCCLPGCCLQLRSVWPRSGPMGWVGFVHGGLGAPSCRVRSWLCRLGGCARRLLVVLG